MYAMWDAHGNNDNKLVKKNYIVFISKVTQDVRAVITIYKKHLEQIKVNIPLLKFLVVKSTMQDAITMKFCLAGKHSGQRMLA